MTWARHMQGAWEEHAGNPQLPLWLRVSALAYGKHRGNGHARFHTGEVALVLSKVDMATGEMSVPDRHAVQRAIRLSVEYRFLSKGSGARCLIVPDGMIKQGPGWGSEPCPWHTNKRSAPSRKRAAARPLTMVDPLAHVAALANPQPEVGGQ